MLNTSRDTSDYIYFRDYQTVHPWGTTRYRLQCHLPKTPNINNTYSAALDYTNEPGWGEEPVEGSMWRALPEDFVMAHQMGRAAYDKLPCGWPETPSLTLRLDLAALRRKRQESLGSGSLEEIAAADHWLTLASYMTNPVYFYTGLPAAVQGLTSVYYGGGFVAYAPLLPVWTLWSDGGTGGELETVEFQGVQRPLPSATLDLWKAEARSEVEIEVVHILRALMESVTPDIYSRAFYALQGTNSYPRTSADGWSMTAYDYLYTNDAAPEEKYARLSCDFDRSDDHAERTVARLFDIALIPQVTRTLLCEAYGLFLRTTVDPTTLPATGVVFTDTYGPGNTYFTGPLDHIAFRRQPYNTFNGLGSLLFRTEPPYGGPSEKSGCALRFPGYFTRHGSSSTVDYWDVLTGGFLSPTDDRGLFAYRNLWDFHKTWAGGTACKVQFVMAGYSQINVVYSRLAESNQTREIRTDTDLAPMKDASGEIDFSLELGGRIITGATITVQGVWGEDVSAVTWKGTARVEREEDYGGTLVFHTHPATIDSANRYMMTFDSGAPEYNPDMPDYTDEALVSAHTTHSCTRLSYDDYDATGPIDEEYTPPIVDNEVLIRPGDQVEVLTGFEVTGDNILEGGLGRGRRTELPVSLSPIGGGPNSVWGNRNLFDPAWHVPLMETVKGIQLRCSLAYAVARTLVEVYGRESQYVVSLTVPLTVASYNNLGDVYRLRTGNVYGINAYLGSSSATGRYLGNLPAKMHLTEIEPDVVAGTARCLFVGIGDAIRYTLDGEE